MGSPLNLDRISNLIPINVKKIDFIDSIAMLQDLMKELGIIITKLEPIMNLSFFFLREDSMSLLINPI